MNDLEMEIARTLGASSFLVYHTVKSCSVASVRELQVLTGLHENTVKECTRKLVELNVLSRKMQTDRYARSFNYSLNKNEQSWKIENQYQ